MANKIIIKNNEARAHIIGEIVIKPLFTGEVSAAYADNPTIKELIKSKKLEIIESAEEASAAEAEAQKLIEERLVKELDELREKAKSLGVSNTQNMKRETLLTKIAEIEGGQ